MPDTELQTESPVLPAESVAVAPLEQTAPGELTALLELMRQSAKGAEEQRRCAKRQLFWTRLFACSSVALVGLLVCICLVVGPRLNGILVDVSGIMAQASTAIADLQIVTGQLASADIPGILSNVDQLVIDGQTGIAQALTDVQRALQVLESVDISKLNESIDNLNSVIAPLSKLFGK